MLASSDRNSCWTPLKPQHSNHNPNSLANQLWCIDFLTPLPHLSSSLADSLPSLNLFCLSKTDARFIQDGRKAVWSIPYVSVVFFFQFWNRILLHIVLPHIQIAFLKFPSCDNQARVYTSCFCSCWFEPEIIKIGQSSYMMYSNNTLNIQESTIILNACTKSLETYWMHHVFARSSSSAFYSLVIVSVEYYLLLVLIFIVNLVGMIYFADRAVT